MRRAGTALIETIRQVGILRTAIGLPGYVLQMSERRRTRTEIREALAREGFDAAHGTDTAEVLFGLELGAFFNRSREAVFPYIPTYAETVRRPISLLPIDHSRFTFVDLGCGKGKPLLVASRFPFKKLVGVDLSRVVLDVAENNLAVCRDWCGPRSRFDLRCEDVESFVFPDGPLVIYLFNPFPQSVLSVVVKRLEASLSASPREAVILYVNPEWRSAIESSPAFARIPTALENLAVYATRPERWAWPEPTVSQGNLGPTP